jgi:hypothetical protein
MPRAACCLALALSIAVPALAQEGSIPSETDFKDKVARTAALRKQLFKGEIAPEPGRKKEHQEAIDVTAAEYPYSLYWHASDRGFGKIHKIVGAFETQLGQVGGPKGGGPAMLRLFCKSAAARCREVILGGNAIASVNAARMFYLIPARKSVRGVLLKPSEWAAEVKPRLAGDTGEYVASTLCELITNNKVNDGARYYLLRALADLVSLPKSDPPLLKKEAEDKAISAALWFLTRKTEFMRATRREELEGYKVLRGQAIRILAATGRSTFDKDKPALHLARIAGGDIGYGDYPRLEERIDAAAGLARLIAEAEKHPGLQPDYAAHQVAVAVAAFARDANTNIAAKTPARLRPWKVDAGRLLEVLDEMSASKDPYVKAVVAKCKPVLDSLVAGTVSADAAGLASWAFDPDLHKLASKSLFKGDDNTAVMNAPIPPPPEKDDN